MNILRRKFVQMLGVTALTSGTILPTYQANSNPAYLTPKEWIGQEVCHNGKKWFRPYYKCTFGEWVCVGPQHDEPSLLLKPVRRGDTVYGPGIQKYYKENIYGKETEDA